MLILAVQLLNVNHLLCPGWVSDTAPFSVEYVNENHVLSVSSLPAVGSRIMNESQGDSANVIHVLSRSFANEGYQDVNHVRTVTESACT